MLDNVSDPHAERETEETTDSDTSLNQSKLGFVIIAVVIFGVAAWLGTQFSQEGVSPAGRIGLRVFLIVSLLAGITLPLARPQIPGLALGGFLASVGLGMLAGVFIPMALFAIPADIFSTLVQQWGTQLFSAEEWSISVVLAILSILLALALAYFIGAALRVIHQKIFGWLHKPSA